MTHPPAPERPTLRQPPRPTFRAMLWEYLGHPADETPERRRILYAIVILRLGLGLLFLLRGWSAVFAAPPDAFATRLGDPARWGLGALGTDTTLFILGCTELGVGALLIAGAFTRVSAVTGAVLLALSFAFGQFRPEWACVDPCNAPPLPSFLRNASEHSVLLVLIGGLLPIIVCGSPFLSADRALDKLEEEERDRAPATLPRLATATPLALRLGFAVAIIYYGLPYLVLGRSWLAFGLTVLVALPLILGLGIRASAVILGMGILAVGSEDLVRGLVSDVSSQLLGIITVYVALVVTGAGTVSLDRRLDRWRDTSKSLP